MLPVPGEALAATPLERDGVRLGALLHDAALREEPELLDAVAAAGRLALHNERLALEVGAQLADAQASRRRIVEAGDAERRRLERDLHDGAQQRLVALLLELRALERRSGEAGDVALADALDELAGGLTDALAEVRRLARGIRPPVLEEEGLGPALRALAARCPLPVEVDARLARRHPAVVESAAYFTAAEALANALKYAGASRVELSAHDADGALVLAVRDDGRGGADPAAGSGLAGMADRLAALGGTLVVDSPAHRGTTIVARLPGQPSG
jgi:signal transduction histidine kinase